MYNELRARHKALMGRELAANGISTRYNATPFRNFMSNAPSKQQRASGLVHQEILGVEL